MPSTRALSFSSLVTVACSATAWAATEAFFAAVYSVIRIDRAADVTGGAGKSGFGSPGPSRAMPLTIAWARMTISASVLGNRAIVETFTKDVSSRYSVAGSRYSPYQGRGPGRTDDGGQRTAKTSALRGLGVSARAIVTAKPRAATPRQAGDLAKQADNVTEQAASAAQQTNSVTEPACYQVNQGCSLKKHVRRTPKLLAGVTRRTNYRIKEATHHSLLTNFTAKGIDRPMPALNNKIENLSPQRTRRTERRNCLLEQRMTQMTRIFV
jgi:hypothetical protein